VWFDRVFQELTDKKPSMAGNKWKFRKNVAVPLGVKEKMDVWMEDPFAANSRKRNSQEFSSRTALRFTSQNLDKLSPQNLSYFSENQSNDGKRVRAGSSDQHLALKKNVLPPCVVINTGCYHYVAVCETS